MSQSDANYLKSILKVKNSSDTASCLLEQNEIRNLKSFGDKSINGDISLVDVGDKGVAILKKIPIDKFTDIKDRSTALGAELTMLQLVTELSNIGITRHFSTLVSHSICNSCEYANPALRFANDDECLTTVSPYSNGGTFRSFLYNKISQEKEIAIGFFQIFSAIYCLQTYFNATHHDLHWSNVFLTRNDNYREGAYDLYQIAGKNYYLPSYPFIFQIADFGMARIPNKIDIARFAKYYASPNQNPPQSADYMRITSMLWAFSKSGNMTDGTMKFLEDIAAHYRNGSAMSSVIESVFASLVKKPKNAQIMGIYDLDRKVPSFNYKLSKFVRPEMLNEYAPIIPAPPNSPIKQSRFQMIITSLFNDVEDRMDVDDQFK